MDEAGFSELVADLAEAGVGGRTRVALARGIAETFSRRVVLVAVEIGWCEASRFRASTVTATRGGERWQARESTRELRRTALAAIMAAGTPAVRAASASSEHPDLRELGVAGARFVVVLPHGGPGVTPGYVALGLHEPLPAGLSDPVRLRLLTQVLRAGYRNCGLIERVAVVSRRAHVENARLRREVAGQATARRVVAQSPRMREALARLDAVANHDTTVLLLGESGTGKSLLARRLHARSARAERPFVAVNCGALPEGLLESELFGHEEGAFTGATRARRGRFVMADGGTLFLDEVAELPLAAQVKLLRVLQDGELESVGGERTVSVAVRLVAATNQPLAERVRDGRFREDLYYRLDVFPLEVPPLRERVEDIPELAAALLAEIDARLQGGAPRLGRRALAQLLAQPWPGNVRELANTLERAAILSRGGHLELGPALDEPRPSPYTEPRAVSTFEEGSRRCIEAALRSARGKLYGQGGAAELLDLKPSTLQTKMRKLGIRREDFVTREP